MKTAIILSLVLFAGVFFAFSSAKNRTGRIILPGGVTYLGPTPTSITWATYTGKVFPYSFSHPSSLSLGFFPNDPTDGVTLFLDNTDPGANLFFRVEVCKGSPCEAKTYANDWWKEYNWKSVKQITEFTNSNGLKGFRATYIAQDNTTPYDHVFFEVPDSPDKIIWISGKLFTKEIFDKLVDSVEWK